MDLNTILQLRTTGLPWSKIARFYGVSRQTMYNYRVRYALDEPNLDLMDAELIPIIENLAFQNPTCGSVSIRGHLLARGIKAAENRIRRILRLVDPHAVQQRCRRRLVRRQYNVPGANYLWSLDGHHKLVMFHIVTHGCIDGFSRKIIFLECATNNLAETVFNDFIGGLHRSGLPKFVRGDHGCENTDVATYMGDRFFAGSSNHNQRIERLWRDVHEKSVSLFKEIFLFMETEHILDESNVVDIFCLQYVFLPRIQAHLDDFTEMWNNHSVRTEHMSTPNQMWLLSMLSQNPNNNFNLSSTNPPRTMDSIIRHISQSSNSLDVPNHWLELWVQIALDIVPDPFVEDHQNGIFLYCTLREQIFTLTPDN